MANSLLPPNLTCPVPSPEPERYYTDQQSQLNVSRKDKFRLIMDVPEILKPILKKENRTCNGGNLDRLQMSIWGFVVPDIKIKTIKMPFAGQNLVFSGLAREEYKESSIKFTVDNRYDNYFILYKWLDIQNDDMYSQFDYKRMADKTNGHLCNYASMFTVMALDEYDKPTAQWEYYGAFPTSLGSIEATYRATDELESSFTFAFSQIKMTLL